MLEHYTGIQCPGATFSPYQLDREFVAIPSSSIVWAHLYTTPSSMKDTNNRGTARIAQAEDGKGHQSNKIYLCNSGVRVRCGQPVCDVIMGCKGMNIGPGTLIDYWY